jgi:hypothetical protein
MKALIFENKIVDVSEQEFDVNESLTWIDCPDDCVTGRWELVDGVPKEKEIPSLDYYFKRKREYPSIGDQLDDIYHNGVAGWKTTIKVTKDKYPKG